jgi:hypothetical protein
VITELLSQDIDIEKEKQEREFTLAAMRQQEFVLKQQMKAVRSGAINLQLPYYQGNIQQLTNGFAAQQIGYHVEHNLEDEDLDIGEEDFAYTM